MNRVLAAVLTTLAVGVISFAVWRFDASDSGTAPGLVDVEQVPPAERAAGDEQGADTATARDDIPAFQTMPRATKASDPTMAQRARAAAASEFAASEGDRPRYEVLNLAQQFVDLTTRAQTGDLIAARTLYDTIESCRSAPRTPQRLQE